MAQYIDKSALVAEIERLQDITMDEDGNFYTAKAQAEYNVLCMLESSLDTLEVKEVDLEKDVESYWKQCDLSWCIDACNMTHVRSMLSDIAKHFFELGLTQKGE